jgi:hypothetical protein
LDWSLIIERSNSSGGREENGHRQRFAEIHARMNLGLRKAHLTERQRRQYRKISKEIVSRMSPMLSGTLMPMRRSSCIIQITMRFKQVFCRNILLDDRFRQSHQKDSRHVR